MRRYATYGKFFNADQAAPMLAILKEHAIPFEFEEQRQTVDPLMVGGQPTSLFEVKIAASEFETVNRLLLEKIQVNLNDVDPDHYLFQFEDAELVEILRKPDEWGRLDFLIARQILASRGIVYSAEELDNIWKNRMETLARPESSGGTWIPTGYTFGLFGGVIGVMIGMVLWQSTKTLPNGKRYYIYDEATRKQGKNIVFFSVLITAIALTVVLCRSYVLTNG